MAVLERAGCGYASEKVREGVDPDAAPLEQAEDASAEGDGEVEGTSGDPADGQRAGDDGEAKP